ncbi:MAG TPA: hypothetical protein PKY88_03090 [Anaerohalosphaeraceae bacterium]|nr:hypothetical protein [Anaerohalosphaeraceae bacterium]
MGRKTINQTASALSFAKVFSFLRARLETGTKTNTIPTGNKESVWLRLPLGLPLAVFLSVYLAYFTGWTAFYKKSTHEILALLILAPAFLVFFARTCRERHPLFILLTTLTGAFFLREWHFNGTSTGIYIALAVLAAFAWRWKKALKILHQWHPMKIWLFAAFITYGLSQFTARRGFRILHLPLEHELHVGLEEVLETAAHLMLLYISFLSWRFSAESKPKPLTSATDSAESAQ